MRPLILLVFVLSWVASCVGCGVKQSAQAPHREMAAQLSAETVALVRLVDADGDPSEDGRARPFCAGVWVSPKRLITAGHCVENLGEPPERTAVREANEELDLGLPVPPWDPIGQTALFAQQGDLTRTGPTAYWTGKVVGFNKSVDLGLVETDDPYPRHPYAHLSEGEIVEGDRVEWVGHPYGDTWSYAEGYVSRVHFDRKNAVDVESELLQVAGPMSPGNSGSGVFNEAGQLVGIASFLTRDNGMGFCVHRDVVRAFLASAGDK